MAIACAIAKEASTVMILAFLRTRSAGRGLVDTITPRLALRREELRFAHSDRSTGDSPHSGDFDVEWFFQPLLSPEVSTPKTNRTSLPLPEPAGILAVRR